MKVVLTGGETIELGETETNPTIGITDYSRRVTDDFGVTTVVERGFSRRLSTRLSIPFDNVDAVQRRLAGLRATAAQWVADDRFAWLKPMGFFKEFEVDLAMPPVSFCSLSVEGFAESGGGVDPGGDPAPAGGVSTLLMLRPVIMTDAVLVSSNIPENDAALWSGATVYPTSAKVIRTHRVYESLVAGNTNHDPATSVGQWLDVGPTNRWAVFDQALGTTATKTAGPVTYTFNASGIRAAALLDVIGATVRVEVIATGDPVARFDQTVAAGPDAVTFLDLPAVTGQVRITVAGSGVISIGTLLIGVVVPLGIAEAAPSAGITDFSRKDVDDFGEVTIVPRAWAKRMTGRALISTEAVDIVADRIAGVRARPVLWIGEAGLDSLTVYGFFKDFSIEVGESVSKLSLSIEGLSKAAKIEPFTGPPGRDGVDGRDGLDGSDGTPGAPGANGQTQYLHTAYSNAADGSLDFTTGAPGTRKYLGVLVDTVGTDSANPAAYAWSLIKGADGFNGADGTPGPAGADGQPTYVHIAYSNAPDGSVDFSLDNPANRNYVGFYVDQIVADSANPTLYAWSLVKGANGGSTFTLLDVANCFNPGPSSVTKRGGGGAWNAKAQTRESGAAVRVSGLLIPNTFIGITTDPTANPSFDTIDYGLHWSGDGNIYIYRNGALTGTIGARAINQPPVAVAVESNGAAVAYSVAGFSGPYGHVPNSASEILFGVISIYNVGDVINGITFAVNGTSGRDGLNGSNGLPGAPGANGQSAYTHIAFADSADGSVNFTTGDAGGRYYVGIYQDTTVADSGDYHAYAWSRWRGADGSSGIPGNPGADGRTPYFHTAYANSADGSVGFSQSPTGRAYLGNYSDFTEADSESYAAYSWALIKGADGTNGSPGAPGADATSLEVSTAQITVKANSDGTIKSGQLPRSLTLTVKSGANDVTAAAQTQITLSPSSGVTASRSGATIMITAVTGSGYIDVSAIYNGVAVGTKRIAVIVEAAAPPPASPTTLGDDISTSVVSTTYGSSFSPAVILKAAGGTLGVQGYVEYVADPGSGTRSVSVAARFAYRSPPGGGAWNYPTSEQAGPLVQTLANGEADSGAISISQSATGFSVGTVYELAIAFRKVLGSAASASVSGAFSGSTS